MNSALELPIHEIWYTQSKHRAAVGTQEIAYIASWESKDIALAALPWVNLNMMQN